MRWRRRAGETRRGVVSVTAAMTLALTGMMASGAPGAHAGVPGCAWQQLPLLNGWQSAQGNFGTGDPSYCAASDGMVYLSGSLTAPSGPSSDEFAQLPASAAPAHSDYLSVYTMNGTAGVLRIDPDGTLHAYSGQAAQFTSLAAVSFPAAPLTGQGLMPLLHGWQSAQSMYDTGDPSWYVSGGIAHLTGSVYNPGGSPLLASDGWIFAVLPSQARPTGCFDYNVYTFAGGTGFIDADGGSGNIRAANGQFTSLAGVSYPAAPVSWQPLTLLSSAVRDLSCQPPSWYISGGVVYLTGPVLIAAGFNGQFATLPPGARPAHTLYLIANGDGPGMTVYVTLRIDPSGAVSVFNGADYSEGYAISLSGLSWHTLS